MMNRETWISFGVPLLVAVLLRVAVAADTIFRPDGWNSFAADNRWQAVKATTIAAAALGALLAFPIFMIYRLRASTRKWATGCALAVSLVCSVALFCVGVGEPYLRLYLHKPSYDAVVRKRTNDSVIVFDWGETARFFGRALEYLVFARGDQARTLSRFEQNDNGGREADIQEDEFTIRGPLSSAWGNAATREKRFKIGVLDNCRLQVHRLTGGYFYLVDDC